MPIYTFECVECGKIFEVTGSIDDYKCRVWVCPKCGSDNLTRRLDKDITNFRLDGDGWTK